MSSHLHDADLAGHILFKSNISVIRRLRKTDNNRIARATGATIVSRTDEIQESDIGTRCGQFEIRKIGDELSFCISFHVQRSTCGKKWCDCC